VELHWTVRASFCDREGFTSPLPPANQDPDAFKVIYEMDTLEMKAKNEARKRMLERSDGRAARRSGKVPKVIR
jgi:hypothetical protein